MRVVFGNNAILFHFARNNTFSPTSLAGRRVACQASALAERAEGGDALRSVLQSLTTVLECAQTEGALQPAAPRQLEEPGELVFGFPQSFTRAVYCLFIGCDGVQNLIVAVFLSMIKFVKVDPQLRSLRKMWLLSGNQLKKTGVSPVKLVTQPVFSPYLAPCDFFIFPKIKDLMRSLTYTRPEEAVVAFNQHIQNLPSDQRSSCFQK
ncbi:hypothetical protein EVAR_17764_1 [Eumeta japonica]|uniref:Uncharacterized protein n=1 Tax=Eumeta variegata TaxID=151549 RepID=A0A4C1TTC9_EUMVA|nr:hypothetical protein EVAR_17764_1 [Eumeta japonica]